MTDEDKGKVITLFGNDETALVKSDSLDQRLVLPTSKGSLSEREFLDLIALADSLRQFDERKGDRAVLDTVEETLVHGDNYPVAVAYEIAQSLGISADYVERAIALRYLTEEQQFADIKEHSAVPGFDNVVNTYIRKLTERLQGYLPLDEIDIQDEIYSESANVDFRKVFTHCREKSFLMWQWTKLLKEKVSLADFEFQSGTWRKIPENNFNLRIKLNDPSFLRACGDTLEGLNQHFGSQLHSYEVTYHYVIE